MKEKIEELGHGYLLGLLTAKRLGGKQFDPPPLWFFQKGILQRKGEALGFSDFYYHKSHLF